MESNENEIIQAEVINMDMVYQQNKAEIDMQIATAKQFPRNVSRSTSNALAIVTLDKAVAATCNYALPRGDKPLQGPSVHLAKILAQNWGNMRIDAKVTEVGAKTITSQAVAFDLENNFAVRLEVKRSIMTKIGRMKDDMIVVTGNAANAIAMRNAIFAVIPKGVVDKVYNAAKQTLTGDISDKNKLTAERVKIFAALKEMYEVTEAEILSVVKRAHVDHVTGDDLVLIIGIGQAIKDGDTTPDMAFRGLGKSIKPDEITIGELKDLFNLKGENLKEDEKIHIERVIKNEEVLSYKKAMEILKTA